MHLHWLILFLVSLAVTATDHPSATRSLLHQTFSSNTSQGRVFDTEDCTASEYGDARIQLWKDLGLDHNDSQSYKKWPLMFNYKYYTYYAKNPANIYVDLYVTSITNVNEKDHSLTTQVKMITAWPNLNMTWNPKQYCGIETFSAPKDMFWTPDIGIIESTKTDFGTKESPNVMLLFIGFTVSAEIFALTTACKMDLYKFPFDTQSCRITLQSTAYTAQEIELSMLSENKTLFMMESKALFQAEGEWELVSIDNSNATVHATVEWIQMHQLIYQITIKRRPLLYVVNIIVPIFFFLVLDVISFFIKADGEKKVCFKVTLLLSISVMLLLVNDMLPSTSERIPLIGIYCCTIFCLLGISIVETVIVDLINDKGDGARDQQNPPDSVRDQNEEQSNIINLLNQILTEVRATNQQNQQQTKVAKIIDRTFLVLYIISIIVFMSVLWSLWFPL